MSESPALLRKSSSQSGRGWPGQPLDGACRAPSDEAAAGGCRARDLRKAHGVYYTPVPVVRYIVRRTLHPLLACNQLSGTEPLRVLDPACGAGVFLQESYRYLLKQHRDRCVKQGGWRAAEEAHPKLERTAAGCWRLTPAERKRILQTHVFGVDVDGGAVEQTRRRLACMALGAESRGGGDALRREEVERLAASLAANIRCGDALINCDFAGFAARAGGAEPCRSEIRPFAWETEFAQALQGPSGGFDAVVANPPYVNIRLLTKVHGSAVKEYLRTKYRCAYRAYDAYVLFFEKAFQLLRPNGRCGMIAPNSIATLDYALPCRSLLIEETTIRQIVDVSGLSPFPGVGVYPYILVWEKRPPTRRDKIEVLHARSLNGLSRRTTTLWVPQAGLSAQAGLAVHGTLDVESRVATEPLGRRARLHSGATGFAAQRLAGQLMEKGRQRFGKCFEFIVSGNIDRYQVRLGGVQFIKRKFTRPVLPAGASVLSAAKRQLYGDPKIVIAGVTRRLEAAWDGDGLALGVQVYAAAEPKDDPWLLLALLNSKLLSHLFRIRFQAKQLRGGFLAVNKGQLEKLPIRIIEDGDRDCRLLSARLAQLAAQMHRLHQRRRGAKSPDSAARLTQQIRTVDREIDQIVYQLYKLTDEEISQVEASVQTTGLSLDNSDASR